jgi:hypothetical protein
VYRHLVALLVFLFVFTFPFAYVQTLGVVIVPATCIVCLGYYGVSELAQELENPLGYDANDIDLRGLQDIMVAELHAAFKFKFGQELVMEADVAGDTNGAGVVAPRGVTLMATIDGVAMIDGGRGGGVAASAMKASGSVAVGVVGTAAAAAWSGGSTGPGAALPTSPVHRLAAAAAAANPEHRELLAPGQRMPGGFMRTGGAVSRSVSGSDPSAPSSSAVSPAVSRGTIVARIPSSPVVPRATIESRDAGV